MREIYHMSLNRKLLLLAAMLLLLIVLLMVMKQYMEQDQDVNNGQTEYADGSTTAVVAESEADQPNAAVTLTKINVITDTGNTESGIGYNVNHQST